MDFLDDQGFDAEIKMNDFSIELFSTSVALVIETLVKEIKLVVK